MSRHGFLPLQYARMHTLLLAAGRSRRFWPLDEKSLVPMLGKTLIEHQVKNLREGGCRDITIVAGEHNMKELRKLFPSLSFIRQKDLEKGMLGALESALPKMKGPVMIVSGNDVIDPSAYQLLRAAASEKGTDGALLARKVTRYFPGGYLETKGKRIVSIIEKPGEGNEPSKLVNIVAHIHNDPSSLLAELRRAESGNDDGYERALASLFPQKKYVAVSYDGPWQAVKYPWHLLPLLEMQLACITERSISPRAFIHPTAAVEGNVIIEEGAKIMQHATVAGPCYIGKGSVIGTGALVRHSSIGERCVVGFGSEVKGSILMRDVWTHMTYVGDSVIAENVSFGGGTVTGNFRLDEEEILSACDGAMVKTGLQKFGTVIGAGSRIGIQVGTNPGVKIGRGSFIGGGTYVTEDMADGSFALMKEGKIHIRPNRALPPSTEKRAHYMPKSRGKTA